MYFFKILRVGCVLVFRVEWLHAWSLYWERICTFDSWTLWCLTSVTPHRCVLSSHLLPSFLRPSLHFLLFFPLMVNSHIWLRTHVCLRSQPERQYSWYYCAVTSPKTKLVSLLTLLHSDFISLTPSLVPGAFWLLKTSKACFESSPIFFPKAAALHQIVIFFNLILTIIIEFLSCLLP